MPQAEKKSITTAKICAAHGRAYVAMRLAIEARDQIEARVFHGIGINVSAKGPLRTTSAVRKTAKTHEDIDRICAAYIRTARKDGLWGWQHNETKGRLDSHGVFHALDAACCPQEGAVVTTTPVGQKRQRFDKSSLAEYRQRIAALHARLDEVLADVAARNKESGWTSADARVIATKERLEKTWRAVLDRAQRGSRADILQVCRHQRNLLEREFSRNRELGDSRRSYEEFVRDFNEMAQFIIWSIARGRA